MLRDVLSLKSATFEGSEYAEEDIEEEQRNGSSASEGQRDELDDFPLASINRKVWIVLLLILITALILFAPAVIHDRCEKQRLLMRVLLFYMHELRKNPVFAMDICFYSTTYSTEK